MGTLTTRIVQINTDNQQKSAQSVSSLPLADRRVSILFAVLA